MVRLAVRSLLSCLLLPLIGCGADSTPDRPFAPPIEPASFAFPEPGPEGAQDLKLDDLLTPSDYSGPPLAELPPPRPVFAMDFESGELPPLWTAPGSNAELERVTSPTGNALAVTGGSDTTAVVPLGLVPISDHAAYRVNFLQRTENVRPAGGRRIKSATMIFQVLRSNDDPTDRWLEDPPAVRGAAVPRDFRPSVDNRGTTGWQRQSVPIEVPDEAWTHAALSLAYVWPLTGKAEDVSGQVRGTVYLDDVELIEQVRDYARAHARPGGHERQLRITNRAKGMAVTRDALHAPSGSTWSKTLDIPENSRFAGAVMADLNRRTQRRDDAYRFRLLVDGNEVWSKELAPLSGGKDSGWQEVDADLSAFAGAGRAVQLVTEAVGNAPASDRLLWSEPRIVAGNARPPRTVVFIVIDTLGAHRLGYEGGADGVSPVMDRLAAEGTVFRDASAPAPWTNPSASSLLTGYHPMRSGIGTYQPGDPSTHNPTGMLASHPTLAERFRDAGWDTEAALSNPFLHRRFGTDRGFRRFADFGSTPDKGQAAVGVQRVLDWLKRPTGSDRFFYLHLLDPHTPYGPPKADLLRFREEGYAGRWADGIPSGDLHKVIMGRDDPSDEEKRHIINLHDAEIRFTDTQVGRIVDELRALDSDVLLVISSDHGEEFWEHDAMEHGHALYTETLRVPLLFWGTEVAQGRSVPEPVSTARVAASLLEHGDVDLNRGPPMEPSLLAAVTGEPSAAGLEVPVFAGHLLYGNERMMVRTGKDQYIYNLESTRKKDGRAVKSKHKAERYDRVADPWETRNILGKGDPMDLHRMLLPSMLHSMKDRLVVVVDTGGEQADIDLRIAAPGGLGRWAWDYVAPDSSGKEPSFKQDIDPVDGEARFTTSSRLAVFAVQPLGPVDRAKVRVSVDGTELEADKPFEQLQEPPTIPTSAAATVYAFHIPGPPWENAPRPVLP